jgi:cell division protein FtsZ
MMQFELPQERPSIIKVIGVGGGGSNAVNYMYKLGIKGVDFIVCNTDHQALDISPVPTKIQLGPSLTEGRGAGAIPEVGKHAAIENIEEIREILRSNTKMVFITAGMGGGTGTGAAPIIAGVAREMGILTVAIVTIPFGFEGKKRKAQADAGIEELKKNVDTLLVICNDKLREIHGNLKISEAFGHADDILAVAAKSIAEIITQTLHINVDFADVQTVMKQSGVAIMGAGSAEGSNRAMEAAGRALDSPLLNDNEIQGARYILLNITSGEEELSMDEMGEINDFIQEQAGSSAEVIMGLGTDPSLGKKISVTIIATGFKTKDQLSSVIVKEEPKILYDLSGEVISGKANEEVTAPVNPEPVSKSEETAAEAPGEMFSFFKPSPVDGHQEKAPLKTVQDSIVTPTPAPVVNPSVQAVITHSTATVTPVQPVVEPTDEMNAAVATVEETIQPVQSVSEVKMDEPKIIHFLGLEDEIETIEEPVIKPEPFIIPESRNTVFNIQAESTINSEPVADEESTFVFEVNMPSMDEPEISTPEPVAQTTAPVFRNIVAETPPVIPSAAPSMAADDDDPFNRAKARISALREISFKMSTPNGLADLEKEPAYKRRNVVLDDIPTSNENNISRFTLSQDKENKPEIKGNNPFLHDRVD